MEKSMNQNGTSLNTVIGLSILGSIIVGVASLVAALAALIEGDHLAVGVCLLAAAVSFGLLASAVLKG
jgi:hypothetical protein